MASPKACRASLKELGLTRTQAYKVLNPAARASASLFGWDWTNFDGFTNVELQGELLFVDMGFTSKTGVKVAMRVKLDSKTDEILDLSGGPVGTPPIHFQLR